MQRLLAALLALTLTACQLGPASAPPPALHDLGAPPEESSTGQWATLPLRLAIQVSAPPWLDDGAVHYRRSGDTQLAGYRDHRWAAPPSQLLARRLSALLAPPPPGSSSRWLEIDLQDFEQRFLADGGAEARLRARAIVSTQRGGALLASRDFALDVGCKTADVKGGIAAQANAIHALARQIAGWLATIDPADAGAVP